MCLTIDNSVQIDFDESGWAKCYKIIGRDNVSPWQAHLYEVGVVASNRVSKALTNWEINSVNKGIHVFMDMNEIYKTWIWQVDRKYRRFYKIIEVWCHKDDLVAVGRMDGTFPTAIFMKVTIKSLEDVSESASLVESK